MFFLLKAGKIKTRSPMSESALVTGIERTKGRLLFYFFLFNQKLPTNPIIADLDVGCRLALASKTTGLVTVFIIARFISEIGLNVKVIGEIS